MLNTLKKLVLLTITLVGLLSSHVLATTRHYTLEFATINPPHLISGMKDTRNVNDGFTASGNLVLDDSNGIATRTLSLCLNAICQNKTDSYTITGYAPGTSAVFLRHQDSGEHHSIVFIWNYFNLGFMETLPNNWGSLANQNLVISWKDNNGGSLGGGNTEKQYTRFSFEDALRLLTYENSFANSIQSILTQNLKMSLYLGDNPPEITGTYQIDNLILKEANVPDSINRNFGQGTLYIWQTGPYATNALYKLIYPDNNANYYMTEGGDLQGLYFGGNGNYFTGVFRTGAQLRYHLRNGNTLFVPYFSLVVISGEVDKNTNGQIVGIRNLEYALIMLNNHHSEELLLQEGHARKFVGSYVPRIQ